MNNQFKHNKSEDDSEYDAEPIAQQSENEQLQKNFFSQLFTEGVISKAAATQMIPFFLFIAFLALIYIGNRHFAESNIRDIDKLSNEVKELSWDFKTLKASLMLKSTQTEVAKMVDTLGLMEPTEPPRKIVALAAE